MTAINQAYTSRNLEELQKLARGMRGVPFQNQKATPETQFTVRTTREILEAELAETRRKLQEIRGKIKSLRFHPAVQFSLDIKLASQRGQNMLHEMKKDLEEKIARKTVERDYLRSQLAHLGHVD